MDLHLKTGPGEDGITRVVQLNAADLAEKKRHRKLQSLTSFVAFLARWGNATLGTIYWTKGRVVAVLNEQDMASGRGDQDTVTFAFERPVVAKRWLEAIGKSFNHKAFKEFLELRFNEIQGGADFYTKIANLSLAQTFTYDGKLDSDQTYQIAFKSEAGADVAKLPKHVEVYIPLINGLEKAFCLKLRLKFTAPTSSEGSPSFRFEWDDQDEVLEEAAKTAADTIEAGLPGWLVVQGQPTSNGREPADF